MTKHFSLLLSFLLLGSPIVLAQADALLGEWINEKKDARIKIYKLGNTYNGRITWGEGEDSKDVKNPDPKLRNRELVGSSILIGFTYNGDNTWVDGTIYDPREGKTYSCKIALKNKNTISIRGFVGISMFGRSEVWNRYQP